MKTNTKKAICQNFLKDSVFDNISNTKKKFKVKDNEFRIIRMEEYELMKTNQYKVSQLKEICNHYNIRKTGNKDELINNIYNFLKYSLFAITIQKNTRGFFLRKYERLAGPAFKKRSLCINDTDFATLDPLKEIPFNQFYSFKDNEDNVYGCNIISLYELVCKKTKHDIQQNKLPLNPYNREPIDKDIIDNFSRYMRLAKVNRIEHIIIRCAVIYSNTI